jgi:hypothetical protein
VTVLTPSEKAAREQTALAKCADFELVLTKIINAGLEGPNPFFLVYDLDGKPWPIRPDQMTVGDILAYVHSRFGELFLGFCRTFPQLIVH